MRAKWHHSTFKRIWTTIISLNTILTFCHIVKNSDLFLVALTGVAGWGDGDLLVFNRVQVCHWNFDNPPSIHVYSICEEAYQFIYTSHNLYPIHVFGIFTSKHLSFINKTGRGSSIGSVSAWHASGPEFDPHVRHILSWRLGHEKISTAILPLPLIQEE